MQTDPTAIPPMPAAAREFGIDSEVLPEGTLLVRVTGAIDLQTAPELRTFMESVSPEHGLVLDLDGVGFLGSPGLSVLAELAERAHTAGLRWCVVATNRVVLRPIEVTGLDVHVPVYATLENAVTATTG